METMHPKDGITHKATAERTIDEVPLKERVDHVRDLVEDLRDRAEIAVHEHPYLVPVATGVLGIGVGVLIGSKLSRMMLLTAAGALLSDKVRAQVAKLSRDLVRELQDKVADDGEDVEDVDTLGPSMT